MPVTRIGEAKQSEGLVSPGPYPMSKIDAVVAYAMLRRHLSSVSRLDA